MREAYNAEQGPEQSYGSYVAEKAPTLDERAAILRSARQGLPDAEAEVRIMRHLLERAETKLAIAREEVKRAEAWFGDAVARVTQP